MRAIPFRRTGNAPYLAESGPVSLAAPEMAAWTR
jgi:hypothetical protein